MSTPRYLSAPPSEAAPSVVLWARLYATALGLLELLAAVIGVALLAMGAEGASAPGEELIRQALGGVYLVLGLSLAGVCAWAALAGRRKYAWYLHLVLMILGCTSCACLPFGVPLIVYWLRPETKAWYGV